MNNMITIIKKELRRFFCDKRLFFTTVLLPGLMIYIVYSLMGSFMQDNFHTEESYEYQIVSQNMPPTIASMLETAGISTSKAMESDEYYKDQIRGEKIDAYIIFEEDFENAVATYEISLGIPAPQIEIYYLSTRTESQEIYQILGNILENYETSICNKFDVNENMDISYDLASDEDITGMIASMLMPMLLMLFLFSGCSAVAPESIAGEKERGTIATLLVTPMKRSQLAIGKIISLTIIALLCGISSFAGTMLSLPKMMSMAGDINIAVYKPRDFVLLLCVLLSTVLVMIALVSIISANAKSVKEANSTVGPLTVVIMLIGVSGMFGTSIPASPARYLIPLYNSVQCISGVFSFHLNLVNIGITCVSNVIYAIVLIFVLTKMFENEKVMFS